MKIGIFGAGRLGAAIDQELMSHSDIDLRWQITHGDPPDEPVDVAIDASVGSAVPRHIEWAIDKGVDLVIGTTGWKIEELGSLVDLQIGILVAQNFSLSVALMERFAYILSRYSHITGVGEMYLLEHHHSKKSDAPSGTARMLAGAVMAGHPEFLDWTVGDSDPSKLSVGVIRAGSEFGKHIVGLDAPAETLEIQHVARSRVIFAQGAVRSARYIHGKRGVFTFSDLAAEVLDPLFH